MKLFIENKSFPNKVILSNQTYEINRGEHIAITGPSGCGKTTLLRLLSGLDKDYIGIIKEPFNSLSFLFQEDRLVENMSIRRNLMMVNRDEERIKKLLKLSGLENEEQTIVSTLSGGMKRRVSIIRSLLLDYDVLFLDEPFRALDDKNREEMGLIILDELKNKTLVFTTHSIGDLKLLKVTKEIRI